MFQQKAPELNEENPDEIERVRKLARRSLNSNFSINGFERNLFFLNQKGKFKESSAFTGIDSIADARSFAVMDWDLDGSQDVVIKNVRKQLLEAYQNVLPTSNHRVAFRLIGTKSNRDAIGARLMVQTPDGIQMKQMRSAFGFVSQNQREVYFGVGSHSVIDRLEVIWPS
ncbi:MAG: CRTAC1 family protein, partial [Planctomycetota bacterium]